MSETTLTDNATPPAQEAEGTLAMVHLRVADADRAMTFFGALCGWEAERVEFDDHLSHYTLNTGVTVRILDDQSEPPIVPNYRVSNVIATIRAIETAGGAVSSSDASADGSGWARGEDDQAVPFIVFRPGGYHGHAAPTRAPSADVGLVFIRADADRAGRFYGTTLGWELERGHPDSFYFEAVPLVGVFDEAAAFGAEVTPSVTLYLSVDALAPALARVEELGGRAGPAAHDMGPYYSAVCTDDQGTTFGLMALALD